VGIEAPQQFQQVRYSLGRVNGRLMFDDPKSDGSGRFVSLPPPVVEVVRRHRTALAAARLAAPAWQAA
jgi:hypothetical protein